MVRLNFTLLFKVPPEVLLVVLRTPLTFLLSEGSKAASFGEVVFLDWDLTSLFLNVIE
jgi:hypothetical protein